MAAVAPMIGSWAPSRIVFRGPTGFFEARESSCDRVAEGLRKRRCIQCGSQRICGQRAGPMTRSVAIPFPHLMQVRLEDRDLVANQN